MHPEKLANAIFSPSQAAQIVAATTLVDLEENPFVISRHRPTPIDSPLTASVHREGFYRTTLVLDTAKAGRASVTERRTLLDERCSEYRLQSGFIKLRKNPTEVGTLNAVTHSTC